MCQSMPYFMKNKKWYYEDNENEPHFRLTDKAPPKAVESYEEFYAEIHMTDDDGEPLCFD